MLEEQGGGLCPPGAAWLTERGVGDGGRGGRPARRLEFALRETGLRSGRGGAWSAACVRSRALAAVLRVSRRGKEGRLSRGPWERDGAGWRQEEMVAFGRVLEEHLTGFALGLESGYEGQRAPEEAGSGLSDWKDRAVTSRRGRLRVRLGRTTFELPVHVETRM